jgi:hypothetical protein
MKKFKQFLERSKERGKANTHNGTLDVCRNTSQGHESTMVAPVAETILPRKYERIQRPSHLRYTLETLSKDPDSVQKITRLPLKDQIKIFTMLVNEQAKGNVSSEITRRYARYNTAMRHVSEIFPLLRETSKSEEIWYLGSNIYRNAMNVIEAVNSIIKQGAQDQDQDAQILDMKHENWHEIRKYFPDLTLHHSTLPDIKIKLDNDTKELQKQLLKLYRLREETYQTFNTLELVVQNNTATLAIYVAEKVSAIAKVAQALGKITHGVDFINGAASELYEAQYAALKKEHQAIWHEAKIDDNGNAILSYFFEESLMNMTLNSMRALKRTPTIDSIKEQRTREISTQHMQAIGQIIENSLKAIQSANCKDDKQQLSHLTFLMSQLTNDPVTHYEKIRVLQEYIDDEFMDRAEKESKLRKAELAILNHGRTLLIETYQEVLQDNERLSHSLTVTRDKIIERMRQDTSLEALEKTIDDHSVLTKVLISEVAKRLEVKQQTLRNIEYKKIESAIAEMPENLEKAKASLGNISQLVVKELLTRVLDIAAGSTSKLIGL